MFSKSCQYALRAVLYLAVHSSPARKYGVKELVEALDVPGPFLAKILQQLSRQHLISSYKGPSGGFFMSEENLEASLIEVVESIDGKEVFKSCILGLPVCSSENPCPLHTNAFVYRENLVSLLKNHSVAELAERIAAEHIRL